MNRYILLWFSCACIFAQKILNYSDFDVQGYQLRDVGYPSNLIAIDEQTFAYVEFWRKGVMGMLYDGCYISKMNRYYEGTRPKPIHPKEMVADIRSVRLYRIGSSIATTFKTYDKKNSNKIYATFFDLRLNPRGETFVLGYQLRSHDKIVQWVKAATHGNHLIWWAYDPSLPWKKRHHYVAVYNSSGRSLYNRILLLPHHYEGYRLVEVDTDSKGNLIGILMPERWQYTPEDTAFPPILFHYDYRTKTFFWDTLKTFAHQVPVLQSYVQDNTLLLFGVLAHPDSQAIKNGTLSDAKPLPWSHLLFARYDLNRRLWRDTLQITPLPDSLLIVFKERGSNFKDFRIVSDQEQPLIYWLWEEFYTQMKPKGKMFYRYWVAALCYDLDSLKWRWCAIIRKQQRDYVHDKLLSFTPAVSNVFLNILFITEKGAAGKMMCYAINKKTGEYISKLLAHNENSDLYFFPERSAQLSPKVLMLLGPGDPRQNAYRILQIVW